MNRFEQVRSLGRGAFGAVELVKRKNDGKLFAIKTIGNEHTTMTDEQQETAMQEAHLLRELNFLHIVKYFDAWWEGKNQFKIQMEYCDSGSLRDLINSRNGEHFEDTRILDWSVQLVSALKHMHDRRLIHRDIKPDNLLLSKGHRLLKVGDLGIVKMFEHTDSMTAKQIGTASYMAPEVHKGQKYSFPADVFSVGCVIFELVNLKQAFQVPNRHWYAIGQKVIHGEHQDIERYFCHNFIERCFLLDPERRPTIDEAVEILTDAKLDMKQKETSKEQKQSIITQNEQLFARHESQLSGEFKFKGIKLELENEKLSFEAEYKRKLDEIETQLGKLSDDQNNCLYRLPCLRSSLTQKINCFERNRLQLEEERKNYHESLTRKLFDARLQCHNLEKLSLKTFTSSVSSLYMNDGRNPFILWLNDSLFLSYGPSTKTSILTTLTRYTHSKTEVDQANWACLMSNEKFALGHKDGFLSIWLNGMKQKSEKINKKQIEKICSCPNDQIFSLSRDGTVKVLDCDLSVIRDLEGTPGKTPSITNYGHMVAYGNTKGDIYYYDTASGKEPKILTGHTDWIRSLSVQKKILASGGEDWTVRIWSPSQSDGPLLTMEHKHFVTSVRFGVKSTDNKLFSCSWDETTRIWDISNGQEVSKITHPHWARCLDVDPTGQIAVVGHWSGVSLVDERSAKIIKEFDGRLTNDVKVNKSGTKCAVAEYWGQVKMIDLRYN